MFPTWHYIFQIP